MSFCDNHGEGKNGKISSFYVTVVLRGVRHSKRLKLCHACIADLSATFADQWSDGFVLVKPNVSLACVGCGSVVEGDSPLQPLYATGYSKNDQRHDYSALYCDSCAETVISQFRLEEVRNGNGSAKP